MLKKAAQLSYFACIRARNRPSFSSHLRSYFLHFYQISTKFPFIKMAVVSITNPSQNLQQLSSSNYYYHSKILRSNSDCVYIGQLMLTCTTFNFLLILGSNSNKTIIVIHLNSVFLPHLPNFFLE